VFLLYLVVPVLLYLVCAAALPEVREVGAFDLRASYYASSRYFSSLLFAYVAAAMLQAYLAVGHLQWDLVSVVLRVGMLAILLPLAWVTRPWYHWFTATFMLVVLSLRMMSQTLQ
jgi:hypothetical protein